MYSPPKTLCTNCGYALIADVQVPSFPKPDRIHPTRIPSHFDVNQFRSTLSRVRTDISRLDDEIQRIQTTLDELVCTREALYKYTKENEAILSPIERLPPELLSEIFLRSLPMGLITFDNMGFSTLDTMAYRRAVMLPGQICSHWRKVALSMPKLYTSIIVRRNWESRELDVALFKAWLSRTGSLPLSLDFVDLSSTSITDSHPAIDVALPYSNRWKMVRLDYPLCSVENLGVIKGHLQCLETLHISLTGDIETRTQVIDTFEFAPRLHSLCFSSYIPTHLIRIPWGQLTDFQIESRSYPLKDCLDVLDSCPNLLTCSLVWDDSQLVVQRPRICLRHLYSLQLVAYADAGPLLDHLALPVLREFRLFDLDAIDVWDRSQFISFLSRSKCSLQKLELSLAGTLFSDEDLICCLEHTPSLIELDLRLVGIFDIPSTALVRLTNHRSANGQACLAPKLRTFRTDHFDDFDAHAFADMIQSRWRVEEAIGTADNQDGLVKQIETVGIRDLDCTLDPEVFERLHQYGVEGLDISFT